MGAYRLILDEIRRCLRPIRMGVVLTPLAWIVLIGATDSLADPSETLSDEAVSTRPIDAAHTASADAAPHDALAVATPALTRAAAQRHIDEMSPTLWLSQFGHVSIDPRR